MKRRTFITSAIIVLFGGLGTLLKDQFSLPVNTAVTTPKPDADLTFAVLGDIHENVDSFQKAINDLYNINPATDLLVLNGDIVDQGLEEQYTSIKNIIEKNVSKLPKAIIKNIGNHEFFNYKIEKNSPQDVKMYINRYLDFAGEEKVYHDKWINGYHFISLGSEDGNSETLNSVKAYISKDQQKWLQEKLEEKYEKGKPIFVFLHQHLNTNTTGWIGSDQATEIRKILSKYPEVFLFSSHTHRELDSTAVQEDQPFTMVHTGAIHYTIVRSADGKSSREPFVKGIYLEVKGNKVVIKGRDLKEKSWIFTKEVSTEVKSQK